MTPTDFYTLISCTLVTYLVFTEIRGWRQRRANRERDAALAARIVEHMEQQGIWNWEVRLK